MVAKLASGTDTALRPASGQYFMLDRCQRQQPLRVGRCVLVQVHTCHEHTRQGLQPTQKTSLLLKLPGLAGNYSLRERSRRGIKNSIQTCRSGPEAYEQSFRWPPNPSPFREAGRVTVLRFRGSRNSWKSRGESSSGAPQIWDAWPAASTPA